MARSMFRILFELNVAKQAPVRHSAGFRCDSEHRGWMLPVLDETDSMDLGWPRRGRAAL